MPKKVLVVCPREPGFEQYCQDLHAAQTHAAKTGDVATTLDFLEPIYFPPLSSATEVQKLIERILGHAPDLIHFQHEFGFMGSKTPGRYRFPGLVAELRKRAPAVKIVTTAHMVLGPTFKYPWRDRGWQSPLRFLANKLLMPFLRPLWIRHSWGPLDGTIVHSALQLETVRTSGCPRVTEIPHYVPHEEQGSGKLPAQLKPIPKDTPTLLIFGYFTPEKAQDVAIRAMSKFRTPAHLILAGGIRRGQDQGYFEHCKALIRDLGLSERVQITGFVSFEELDALVRAAQLVILPFRESTVSGSLADLMARRAPVLASDLPVNREINCRTPGSLKFFKSEDPTDCARQIEALLSDPQAIKKLQEGAKAYADAHAPEKMALKHREFYSSVISG